MKIDINVMLSRLFHGIICALLIIMLLMCGVFFWGAYRNHCATVHTIESKCQSVLEDVTGKDAKVVESRIESLKNTQKDLFETNTISFFFNLFMIVIVTVGGYILSVTLGNQKDAEKTLSNVRKGLGGFIGSLRFELRLQSCLWALHQLSMNRPPNCHVEIRDLVTMINNDCSLMPISEIGMSPEIWRRHIGKVSDVEDTLRTAGMLDRDVAGRLVELRMFLMDNRERFERRWENLLDGLQIESIDIRDNT